ncbi:hypothetical protein FOQG_18737 [Fusarium oxysporum f. sp. raphani 54005]|uniref:PD-(D/E)XK nuclease-like domain-containing protein n=1 Tax=Fusarium oxysporum f. sp. raphani 54005 TaxID=1089458 RepID=X0B436_FUSOX|nr:hypothetical protein FOQG_18737 [Fusarium oxysporum f. sp. raphani 54005]
MTNLKRKRNMSQHSAKRTRLDSPEQDDDDEADVVEMTPKARSSLLRPHTLPPSESQSQSQSQASGRSSPSKQMDALELSGFRWNRQLSTDNPDIPSELFEFLEEMNNCYAGIGIIPQTLKVNKWKQILRFTTTDQDGKAEIDQRIETDRSFRSFKPFMYADAATRSAIGHTPSIDEVELIINEARECQQYSHPEASWNDSVHFPLLHKAVYGSKRRKQLIGMMNCTTAKLIKEYLRKDVFSKQVDYSFFIDPEADDTDSKSPAEVVTELRKIMPCGVINHTMYRPLRDRPMVVTVETKKRHVSLEAAELQTGTWHAAHWDMLTRRLEQTKGTFNKLPFLPGILVQGHDWSFVVTTREDGKTVVWLEQKFGSTSDMIGVYKAIWGVQRLARWVEDVYWPWYKTNILCL